MLTDRSGEIEDENVPGNFRSPTDPSLNGRLGDGTLPVREASRIPTCLRPPPESRLRLPRIGVCPQTGFPQKPASVLVLVAVLEVGFTGCPACLASFRLGSVPKNGVLVAVLEVGFTGCPACLASFGLGVCPQNGVKRGRRR
jgi:hypothetical protein